MVNVVIVGTGDLAYALAHLYRNNNSSSSGNFLEVTKASIRQIGSTFHETGVHLSPLDDALTHADVVILAIHAKALKTFIPNYIMALKDKVLVDCTNSRRRGEDLETLVTDTGVRWVKAFNDLRALDILTNKASAKRKIVTKMCSPSKKDVNFVRQLAEQSFGLDAKIVPYECYKDMASSQTTIGREWTQAILIMLLVFAVTELYSVFRFNIVKGYAWFHLSIHVTNKAICWTAITGFALAQLPDEIAQISHIVRGEDPSGYSQTLKWALHVRNNLGLISLWFLGVHILMSMLLMGPAYYDTIYIDPTVPTSKMNAIGEASFLFAIIGSSFYAILGIASLPSVGANMTNEQWKLVHGPLAWSALAFATLHVIIMGFRGWDDPETWPGGMPPISMTAAIIPALVLFLKAVELIMTIVSGLFGRESSAGGRDDLQYIRTLIQAGTMQPAPGNDSDKSGATKSSISYNKATGNFECELDGVSVLDSKV